MTWSGTKDNSFCQRLQKCNLTLFKAISPGYFAEETHKHAYEILKSQPTVDIDNIFKTKLDKTRHNTHNQNTIEILQKI